MIINAHTTLASILKQHPKALDAIVSLSPKFEKLRNPLLRKLMAGRTTLVMASKLGGCSLDDFYRSLWPLGFEVDQKAKVLEEEKKPVPGFMLSLTNEEITELDVRPIIASGKDPLAIILEKLKSVAPGHVLKVINSFEPTPLILLLEKRGLLAHVEKIREEYIETYFFKTIKNKPAEEKKSAPAAKDWEQSLQRFDGHLRRLDVRELEMPRPMMAILEALEELPEQEALYVYHKRIPVFLLPELAERRFDYRIKEVKEGEVHLLIFK